MFVVEHMYKVFEGASAERIPGSRQIRNAVKRFRPEDAGEYGCGIQVRAGGRT